VFCNKCSDNFYPLPNQNLITPVRVCYSCKVNIIETSTKTTTELEQISTNTTKYPTNSIKTSSLSSTPQSLINNISNSLRFLSLSNNNLNNDSNQTEIQSSSSPPQFFQIISSSQQKQQQPTSQTTAAQVPSRCNQEVKNSKKVNNENHKVPV
jgi:hypothetical protein